MKKRDKIETVKDLLSDTKNEVLKASEIKFLQSRGIDINLPFTAPLMIFSGDSESKAKIIKSIALKLNCPVIRIVIAKVSDRLPGIVTAPKQKEATILLKQGKENLKLSEGRGAIGEKKPLSIVDKPFISINTQKEISDEPEPIEAKDKVYKLSFPNVWDIDMDDDESMILRLN